MLLWATNLCFKHSTECLLPYFEFSCIFVSKSFNLFLYLRERKTKWKWKRQFECCGIEMKNEPSTYTHTKALYPNKIFEHFNHIHLKSTKGFFLFISSAFPFLFPFYCFFRIAPYLPPFHSPFLFHFLSLVYVCVCAPFTLCILCVRRFFFCLLFLLRRQPKWITSIKSASDFNFKNRLLKSNDLNKRTNEWNKNIDWNIGRAKEQVRKNENINHFNILEKGFFLFYMHQHKKIIYYLWWCYV